MPNRANPDLKSSARNKALCYIWMRLKLSSEKRYDEMEKP
jgi:hypothetical protein